jgi:hypothetical protein
MDTVLKNLVGTECYIYLADCIVFSNKVEEHTQKARARSTTIRQGQPTITSREMRYRTAQN